MRQCVEWQPQNRAAQGEDAGILRAERAGLTIHVEAVRDEHGVQLREIRASVAAGARVRHVKQHQQHQEDDEPDQAVAVQRRPDAVECVSSAGRDAARPGRTEKRKRKDRRQRAGEQS